VTISQPKLRQVKFKTSLSQIIAFPVTSNLTSDTTSLKQITTRGDTTKSGRYVVLK